MVEGMSPPTTSEWRASCSDAMWKGKKAILWELYLHNYGIHSATAQGDTSCSPSGCRSPSKTTGAESHFVSSRRDLGIRDKPSAPHAHPLALKTLLSFGNGLTLGLWTLQGVTGKRPTQKEQAGGGSWQDRPELQSALCLPCRPASLCGFPQPSGPIHTFCNVYFSPPDLKCPPELSLPSEKAGRESRHLGWHPPGPHAPLLGDPLPPATGAA